MIWINIVKKSRDEAQYIILGLIPQTLEHRDE